MRSNFAAALLLLTLSAAHHGNARADALTAAPTHDEKIVRRWVLPGDPHGIALSPDGTIYVGLARPQAVVAIDAKNGAVKKRVILDSAEIAATKELVTLRTNRAATRLFVANGSDESATILALPELKILREITIEGEPIRDALPDPRGRYLFLLGRRVHVYDADGNAELHTLGFDEPTAIAISTNGATLAVMGRNELVFYDTTTLGEISRQNLPANKPIAAALFAGNDRVLVSLSRDSLVQRRIAGTMIDSAPICLPDGSGPQIAVLASPDSLLFAERRCNSSGAFTASSQMVPLASLYGVDAYALAYDRSENLLYATERAGYLTIYRVPRAAVVH